MDEETAKEIKTLVVSHDKDIGIMSQSIEHLVDAIGTTNSKMEDVIDVISIQNVLAEKVTNMDGQLKESFGRVHNKVDKLEEESKKIINPVMLKWVLGIIIAYSVTFGTYIVTHIHDLEMAVKTQTVLEAQRHESLNKDITRLDGIADRNAYILRGVIDD